VRVGLFGGSFDPIHLGHCLVAQEACEQLGLDELLLLPTAHPPHKPDRELTPVVHRLAMARVAVADLARVRVVDTEAGEDTAYTVDTLRWAHRTFGDDADLFLLLGADSLVDLSTWREAGEIRRRARIVVYPRPGVEPPVSPEVILLRGPVVGISATDVRERVRKGRPLRFWVPDAVAGYIARHQLYGEDPC
jgi:nicotinate-nucleotide adenylyltransferase